MSLQFVFGPSGAGKSYRSNLQMIQESMEHPNQNYIILVPEQFTMQTQKDLVNMHPRKGILNIDILSFHRLAYRIFEETGEGNLPILDDEGKNLILRKVAKNLDREFVVLKGNMNKLGYITEVKSVISELMQYDLTPEVLDQFLEGFQEKTALYYKLNDILLLYRAYLQFMEDQFLTKEELMDVLSKAIPKSKLLKNTCILMDGFTGFTPVQLHAIKQLLEVCPEVKITVTIDRNENPFSYVHNQQLFALSKKMVKDLVDLAKEVGIEVKDPIVLNEKPAYRFQNKKALAHLEEHLFRRGKKNFEGKQNEIAIHYAQNPKKETYAAVAFIRKMVRLKNWRYQDVGVIVSNMDVYNSYLESAFAEFEIPVFMDYKRNILLNPFVEYIRSVLTMVDQDFSYLSVFRFLRTNLSTFSYEQVDTLENYCLAKGIRGFKKWNDQWNFLMEKQTTEELMELNELRVQFLGRIEPLVTVLKKKNKKIREITEALYDFMVSENFYDKLKERATYFTEQNELALAKEHEQIYRILLDLFDKLVELLGDERVSLKEYLELLDAGLAETKVGVIPPGVDQVVVGDVERTRLKDVKLVVFLGANDSYLPGDLMRNGLLSEHDRKEFSKKHLALAPCGKERTYTQKFYLYSILTKPSEELHVFYSLVSSEGKAIRSAYLIGELKKMFPLISEIDEDTASLKEKELTEALGFETLQEGFRKRNENQMTEEFWELFGWYKNNPDWQEQVEQMLKDGFFVPEIIALNEMLAKELYGDDFRESISRMEQFYVCAYKHFMSYGIRLLERQEYEFAALDLGNICHKALELYGNKMIEEEEDWFTISQEKQEALMRACVEEAITLSETTVLYSSARNEQLIRRIHSMMKRTMWALREQLIRGDFKPVSFERKFKNGKIDRVDLCEDGDDVLVKVMDYKTGKKTFDVVSLYYGLQLQLMIYMAEAVKIERKNHPDKNVKPAGVFYYQIQDPIVEENDDVEKEMLKQLRPDGVVVAEADVLNHMDNTGDKKSLAIKIGYTKDGSLDKYSQGYGVKQFESMMSYAQEKVSEASTSIRKGKIEKNPYKLKEDTGCQFCPYQGVCGFDVRERGYQYRELKAVDKEYALNMMVMESEEKGNGH